MSSMKQTPSSIDAPSKEFLDQRDVELELMDSNGWHPRLRVKDQTNITVCWRLGPSQHTNGWPGQNWQLGHTKHMDLLAAACLS